MYGKNPTHKPGAKGGGKLDKLPIEKFDDYIPRTPGSEPKKGKLVSAFPIGEKRCRVRRAAYDDKTKLLYIVLSESSNENIYATVQIYQLNDNKFDKLQQPLQAGRIGGIVILGDGRVVLTMMIKDPKQISAMCLKQKWEAFRFDDKLTKSEPLETDPLPQPPQNDSWVLSEAGGSFFLACPEQPKLWEYKKSGNLKIEKEIPCMKMAQLENMKFFPDNKTFITIHRDKPYRWADRMCYHSFIHKVMDGKAKKMMKIDQVDVGMFAIFDKTKVLLSRRKPLWDTLDFLVVDYNCPDTIKLIDSKCKMIRPMHMIGPEKVLVSLDDTKDTEFGLMQLSF